MVTIRGCFRYIWDIIRLVVCCDIPFKFIYRYIKRDLDFPHPIGVVMGDRVKVGRNVIIYQNVTLGSLRSGNEEFPTIKDNVKIYAGAVVVGNVVIEKDVCANALIKP